MFLVSCSEFKLGHNLAQLRVTLHVTLLVLHVALHAPPPAHTSHCRYDGCLKPKHFMNANYPVDILNMGPCIRSWCMTFEAMLQEHPRPSPFHFLLPLSLSRLKGEPIVKWDPLPEVDPPNLSPLRTCPLSHRTCPLSHRRCSRTSPRTVTTSAFMGVWRGSGGSAAQSSWPIPSWPTGVQLRWSAMTTLCSWMS